MVDLFDREAYTQHIADLYGVPVELAKPRKKVSQRSVDYRKATGEHRCGNCVMYHASRCDLVEGYIDPGHVCDKWEAKPDTVDLALGQRHVRTARGVYFFHEPIGTPITEAEYQQLLAQRLAAKKEHESGHPARVAAERAVRTARAMRSSGGNDALQDAEAKDKDTLVAQANDILNQVRAEKAAEGGSGRLPSTVAKSPRVTSVRSDLASSRQRLAQLQQERASRLLGKNANVATRATDKRISQGQTASQFVHPDTGKMMSKSEIGDTYEQLFQTHGAHLLEQEFGGDYQMISHAAGGARNTPLDFQLDSLYGGELKTMSSSAKSQKTAIKAEEIARKQAEVAKRKLQPLLVVQVVDQPTGTVNVYTHNAFASKKVSTMTHIGSYRYTDEDFKTASKQAGYASNFRARSAIEPDEMAARLTSDKDYQRLLDERKAAQAKYPVGHPVRVAAERAVRQARKQIHGGEPTPRVPRTPRTPEPPVRVGRPVTAGTKFNATITHNFIWSRDPAVDQAFRDQADAAIKRQLDNQTKYIPKLLEGNVPVEIRVDPKPLAGSRSGDTTLGSYTGTSKYGLMRLHPKIFPHLAKVTGYVREAPFRELGSEPQNVLREGLRSGWWVPVDPGATLADHVIAHEVGHGVNDAVFSGAIGVNDLGIPDDEQFWQGLARTLGVKAPKPTVRYVPKKSFAPGEVSTAEKKVYHYENIEHWASLRSVRDAIEQRVSRYAGGGDHVKGKPRELFAELWTEYTLNSNPRGPAKFYGDYVKQQFDKAAQAEADRQKLLRSLPDDVQQFDPEKLSPGSSVTFSSPHVRVTRTAGSWEIELLNDQGGFMGAYGRGTSEAVKQLLENTWLRDVEKGRVKL